MNTNSQTQINRIRPFDTKSALVRRYAVSTRLTKEGASDITCRKRLELSQEEIDNDKWLTASALLALMKIHELPGIVHSLTRPFEINITLADAYDWHEVHDDIVTVLKTTVFPEGAEVTVDAIRKIDRSNGGDSVGAQSVPTPAELIARQALKFKSKIDHSLGVCFAWRDSGGSWFDIDEIYSSALSDVRDQLECEGWSTSLERLSSQPQSKLFLVIRPCLVSALSMEQLQSTVHDKSRGSHSPNIWDEGKLRLYTEIRNRQFSERLKQEMDADYPGPFIVPICDASSKHIEYVSRTLKRAGWNAQQQPTSVDGIYQPCLLINCKNL